MTRRRAARRADAARDLPAAVRGGDQGGRRRLGDVLVPALNGQYACENQHLLEDVLKRDWAFRGFVLTDYGAAKSTVNSLNNGLDLDIWPAIAYRPELVNAALATSQASEARSTSTSAGILRTLFAFGFFDRDAYADDTTLDRPGRARRGGGRPRAGGHRSCSRTTARSCRSTPARTGKLALIGPEADAIKDGGGSSAIDEFKLTTPKQGDRGAARRGQGRVRRRLGRRARGRGRQGARTSPWSSSATG